MLTLHMLMALPYEPKTIAACKFLYMYVKSLPWYASISVAMMIGYGIYVKPGFFTYVTWGISTFFIPIIPMLCAAFLGFLISRISASFRKTNIIQTILMCAFVVLAFCSRFIIEAIFKNGKTQEVLENVADQIDSIVGWYIPAGWFSNAITQKSIISFLLLVACSLILFWLIFIPVGKSYRKINSALKSHAASRSFKMAAQKKNSLVQAIAFKEFKRFVGSTNYLVNCGMSEILATLFGIAVLIVGFDKIIAIVTNNAPIKTEMLHPAIPLIIYFFIGMLATTACSPSLEGKNYWIVQSLPIPKKTLYQGKMLFNLYLTIPFAVFGTLCLCISSHAPVISSVLYIVEIIALCFFSTCWGCVCGVKHIKLQWENELEVIKQGAAVTIYLLPNMFVCMGLVVLVVFLGTRFNSDLITVILTVIAAVLALLSYLKVMRLVKK